MTVQELAASGAVLAGAIGVFRWMLKSHEDVCNQRWEAAKEKSDERHEENLIRFQRQDTKLDTIITHLLQK